ncbi:MAG TPA: 3-hydroxyacyl-ACP dehydratase FabZ [Geminicoccus sp.]|jgi:3-hydroxyacyl-[acyl-carrier-protein] dehydratase|uniref:3-hydroxyacyl-ACP dehydratase FabZ n=1 Tax=Geminicoccus sp. TaxID=2024832 RepID=UPI002E35F1B6|nr:3-hydroxyacyl-ACP dehydratase FabZ [Geminicoccus sp.]HEX2527655.1 3-hydroxyacyl-ACP dehydratase FabZ [Geminicoccus sp.]
MSQQGRFEPGTPLPDIDYTGILKRIPHRYPMLMVDRLAEIETFKRAVGIKNVTFNEPFFQGHFPSDPIMPGVLVIEALAQAAAVLVVASLGAEFEGTTVYFSTVDEVKFRRPVRPGDQLKLEVVLERSKLMIYKFRGRALVDGLLATECLFSAKVMTGTRSGE